MLNFNDDNIFVGYIKQLLHSFNLPTAKVVKDENKLYEGGLFLNSNYICHYIDGEFLEITPYIYNKFIPNYTKTFIVNNLIYDSKTHEYLGEYLRFVRDYHGLDLMSLYNCFSNNLVNNLNITFKISDTQMIQIETSENYKIYSLPVKLGQKYTIAIDSTLPVELFCGFYAKGYMAIEGIEAVTYQKCNTLNFNTPLVYDKLINLYNQKYLEYEDNLRLFIKLPLENTSSIVVLEGEYLNTNDKVCKKDSIGNDIIYNPFKFNYNHSVLNFQNDNFENIRLISSLQLLKMNTHKSYPFADRLIEYLIGNVITDLDPISDNIKRLQTTLYERHKSVRVKENKYHPDIYYVGIPFIKYYGVWEPKYKALLYEIAKEMNIFDKTDLLGYFDKDIEQVLGADPDIYKE